MRGAAIAAALLAAAGCKDMGLQELKPSAEAEHAGVSDLVRQTTPPARQAQASQPLHIGTQLWLPTGSHVVVGEEMLTPAGSAGGTSFYRLRWDDPPLDRVLARTPSGMVEYAQVY